MSQISADVYRQAVRAAIMQAWPETAANIIEGRPRKTPDVLPCAVSFLARVNSSPHGVIGVEHEYSFIVVYRDSLPASGNLEDRKQEIANRFIYYLIHGPNLAGSGYSPYVTAVEFDEDSSEEDPTFEVGIAFTVKSHEIHHAPQGVVARLIDDELVEGVSNGQFFPL